MFEVGRHAGNGLGLRRLRRVCVTGSGDKREQGRGDAAGGQVIPVAAPRTIRATALTLIEVAIGKAPPSALPACTRI